MLNRTLKKKKNEEILKKVKSYDDLNKISELSVNEIKILLCCDHSDDPHDHFSHRIQKQEIL